MRKTLKHPIRGMKIQFKKPTDQRYKRWKIYQRQRIYDYKRVVGW